MATKRISKVRQEYYKQEKRIRNIVKRESKRGLIIDINQLLPPRPSRITKASVSRLKEITPEKARHQGYIEYKQWGDRSPLVVPYRQALEEVQMYMEEQKERKSYNERLHLTPKHAVPYDNRSYPKTLEELYRFGAQIAYNQINEIEYGGVDKEIADLHREIENKFVEDAKRKREHPEYASIDELVKSNLEKIRDRMSESDVQDIDYESPSQDTSDKVYEPQEMGDISEQAKHEYYRTAFFDEPITPETMFAEQGYTMEADTILENMDTALAGGMANPDVANFIRDTIEYRIAELSVDPETGEINEKLGKNLLANSIKNNVNDIRSFVAVVMYDSESERIEEAAASLLSIIFNGEVPPMFKTKLDAAMYVNFSNFRSAKARRKKVKEYYE